MTIKFSIPSRRTLLLGLDFFKKGLKFMGVMRGPWDIGEGGSCMGGLIWRGYVCLL